VLSSGLFGGGSSSETGECGTGSEEEGYGSDDSEGGCIILGAHTYASASGRHGQGWSAAADGGPSSHWAPTSPRPSGSSAEFFRRSFQPLP
jgi:hypothetical protein